MLKRFLSAFLVTTLVTGGYFYYLKTNGIEMANNAKAANDLETAAGSTDITATVPFVLTDQYGKKVTEKNLAGKKLLVFFGFTKCPDICPVSMAVLSEVMNQLETAKIPNVQPVFITVDPANDTPEAMNKYLKSYYGNFIALTGEPAELDKVKKAFRVYAETPVKTEEHDEANHANGGQHAQNIGHSNLIYFMDEKGKYKTHFTNASAPEDIVEYIAGH